MPTATKEADIVEAVRGYKANLLREELEEMQELAGMWAEMSEDLVKDIGTLSKDIEALRAAGEVPISKVHELASHKRALAQTKARAEEFAEKSAKRLEGLQIKGGVKGLEDGAAAIDMALSEADGDIFNSFLMKDLEAVESLTAGLSADGSPLKELLMRDFPEMYDDFGKTLQKGTLRGWSPRKIAAELERVVRLPLTRALTIARTEMMRAYRDATRQTYEDSGVVTSYKRMATKSTTTCVACIALDGRVYKVNQTMGDHPNGRCSMIPMVEGFTPEWQSAGDWFRTLDKDDQKKMLGPGKFNAWDDGVFEIEDLAKTLDDPKWGEQVSTRTLKDLTRAE